MDKRWRLECTEPDRDLWGFKKGDPRTAWKRLWEFDEDQLIAHQELVEELNKINYPVVMRIVCSSLQSTIDAQEFAVGEHPPGQDQDTIAF